MTASAKHILVQDEAKCQALKEKINSGEVTFEEVARDSSYLVPTLSVGTRRIARLKPNANELRNLSLNIARLKPSIPHM